MRSWFSSRPPAANCFEGKHARPGEPPGVPTLLETVPLARHPGPMLGSAEALQESVDVGEQQRLVEELVDPG